MQITSNDANLTIFYRWIYNLRDYSTYRVIINVFFALNLKLCKILRFTIRSYDLRSDAMIYNPIYLQRSYVGFRFWQPCTQFIQKWFLGVLQMCQKKAGFFWQWLQGIVLSHVNICCCQSSFLDHIVERLKRMQYGAFNF